MNKLRNLAIIAHVDHGKTTLVDSMLRQSGIFRDNEHISERVMDRGDLEKERGITILAKCTTISINDIKVNIVDTPGHADFGGEVERILDMVEGVILLVDAAEGVMPQTKFVLQKALKLLLKPIVVINKVDKSDADVERVHNEVFDLFCALGANDEQLDFPLVYAAGRDGWASKDPDIKKDDLKDLFDVITSHINEPKSDTNGEFKFLASLIEKDQYLGRILTGKIISGIANVNKSVKAIDLNSNMIENGRISKLLAFKGIEREEVEKVYAGDIVSIAGLEDATVGNTICDMETEKAVPTIPIDPPTISIVFSVNNSPLAGTEGDKVTSRMILDRLTKEAESNVSIKIEKGENNDQFIVSGRGELQLSIIIETMRREGFELSVAKPQVVYKYENGEKKEPIEEVQIDVDDEFSGIVIEKMGKRKAEMIDMTASGGNKTRILFKAPSRGLVGYLSELLTDTRGTAVMNKRFIGYENYSGDLQKHRNGVLISMATGEAAGYSLFNLKDRGEMFISPGAKVYEGMIIGEHSKDKDLEVNPIKGKQLTNMRASGKDDAIKLAPPRKITLEYALSYIEDDELMEITPISLRLRKKYLNPSDRKKMSRQK